MCNLLTRVRNSDTIIPFTFLFGRKGDFFLSFHTFLFPSFALKILLSYVINTNTFSPCFNLESFLHKLFSENTIICLSKLAYIGKNSY